MCVFAELKTYSPADKPKRALRSISPATTPPDHTPTENENKMGISDIFFRVGLLGFETKLFWAADLIKTTGTHKYAKKVGYIST